MVNGSPVVRLRPRAPSRRGFTLVETAVALAILALVIVVGATTLDLGKKDRADWERQIDDVYAVINGLERLRREIEVGRLVAFPPANPSTSAQREFLVIVDVFGRVVVYGVLDGALVAETLDPPPGVPSKRVVIPRIDRVLFHNGADVLAVRFQIFLGGISLVTTARAANGLDPVSLDLASTYGI